MYRKGDFFAICTEVLLGDYSQEQKGFLLKEIGNGGEPDFLQLYQKVLRIGDKDG